MEQRLIDLETRVSFQEHTLQELNDVVARQQQELSAMALVLKDLDRRLRALSPQATGDRSEETPPPHY